MRLATPVLNGNEHMNMKPLLKCIAINVALFSLVLFFMLWLIVQVNRHPSLLGFAACGLWIFFTFLIFRSVNLKLLRRKQKRVSGIGEK